MIDLAKNHIDFGLFTNDERTMLDYWQEHVGLPFEETLNLGAGARQQRHGMNGSVMKINAVRDPMEPAPPGGYRELVIAREGLHEGRSLTDPEGNHVTLVPLHTDGVVGIAVQLAVRDEDAFRNFYGNVLGLEAVDDHTYRCGDSLLRFHQSDDAIEVTGVMRAPGFRYITIQVHDVDQEYAGFIERGAADGAPPRTLGDVARIAFIRDPDGNWIEISQRGSLTGPLPESR